MDIKKSAEKVSLLRVVIKGLLLFLVIDLVVFPFISIESLGKISAYNLVFPGRARLPYGENPDQAYNFSLYNLPAMFASHELSAGEKPSNEFRVLLIGDSSVWGYLLQPGQTLSADINADSLKTRDGRVIHAYNLGYPTMSVTKDLVILKSAMQYKPDLIIWLITLESLPTQKQLESPILQNNPSQVKDVISEFSLNQNPGDSRFINHSYWAITLIGERRNLADLLRLQLYGILWAATGVDQYYPASYDPPQKDLADDQAFQGLQPPQLLPKDLSLDVLTAGKTLAGDVPILFVNEPIYLSQGKNSDIRYNFFYPRWAYDQYRQLFNQTCQSENWHCLDEWDLVPADEFTNSAIHMSPHGTQTLAEELQKAIIEQINP